MNIVFKSIFLCNWNVLDDFTVKIKGSKRQFKQRNVASDELVGQILQRVINRESSSTVIFTYCEELQKEFLNNS